MAGPRGASHCAPPLNKPLPVWFPDNKFITDNSL